MGTESEYFIKDGKKIYRTRCEVYSRVVGYLRPVAYWNDAKKEEFRERKTYKINV